MFTLITVTAVPSFFRRAGDRQASRFFRGCSASEALRKAREVAMNPLYRTVGIQVGNRAKSPVLWVK